MRPKLKANLAKVGVGVVFAMVLGGIVRVNHAVDDRIDEKYNPKKDEETSS